MVISNDTNITSLALVHTEGERADAVRNLNLEQGMQILAQSSSILFLNFVFH